jgi:excisionase family DNA binding protein
MTAKRDGLEPVLLSISDAADLLSCHRNTITRLIKRGVLRTVKVGTMERIPMEAIRALTAAPPEAVRVARPRRKREKAVAT